MTRIAIVVVVLLLAVAVLALLLLGQSSRIARGRLGRIMRLGRLSAYLATTGLGARVRRLFASKQRRKVYDEQRRRADALAITRTMGEMKGAVMKLGQMLSFVSDALPAEYRAALQSLQASAPAMDFALLRDVAERELGRPLERAFASFDEQPLAAASIGQVHRARLPSGEDVVVKIQYPGVAQAIHSDLANAGLLYRMVAMFYPSLEARPVVDELRARVLEELDYRNEARNQQDFHDLYRDHPFIRVPRVIPSHSTGMVLTSELVTGRRFDEVQQADEATRARFAEILYRFVFSSTISFGIFNGDPQPGNYLYDEQGRVAFLDYGCVKRFPPPMLRMWLDMVRAHMGRDRDAFRALTVQLGFLKPDAPVSAKTLYDYFGYFYEPFGEDRVYRFTPEYNNASVAMVFKPQGDFAGLSKHLNMPPDFLFVNRITWGAVSILARLGATGNWHRIHRELLFGAPPSTALGVLDHAYRQRRAEVPAASRAS